MWFSFTLKEEREKEAEKAGGGEGGEERELEKEEDAQEVARLHIHDLINSHSLLLQSLLPTSPLPLPPPIFPSPCSPSLLTPLCPTHLGNEKLSFMFGLCGKFSNYELVRLCGIKLHAWLSPSSPPHPLRNLPRTLANSFNSNEEGAAARGVGCNHCDLKPSRFVS